MNRTNLALVPIAAIAGAIAGVLSASLFSKRSFDAPIVAASEDARVAKLEQQNAQLERAISELRGAQALLATRGERSSLRVDSAPAVVPSQSSVESASPADAGNATAESELTVESALAFLSGTDADFWDGDRSKIWEQVNKAGLLDAVVKAIEERAEREPNNPDLRVDLGNAYLQELFAGNLMKRGYWGTKADEAFDAALELDPQHWEARFTKAVSLSNWPSFTGKQGLAITEFETLVSQQNAGPKKPVHAQTYLYLGNLYQASGSTAKAIEAWQKGAALFPDNEALKQQIASASKL